MLPDLSQKIKAINILSLAEAEGIKFRKSGKYHTGLCPFHSEKTASFTINTAKNRFTCYGCNSFGDPVDFVQKLHGFTFQDALSYLGIEQKPVPKEQYREIKQRIEEAKKKRGRREARQQRERELAYTLGTLIRWTYKAAMALTPVNLHDYGSIYSNLAWFEWGHETLIHGDREEKAYVLRTFKGFPTITRGQLFRKDFDFGKWLRGFIKNGATSNVQPKKGM